MHVMPLAVKLLEPVSDDLLLRLSRLNDGLRFERTASGELLVSPPTGGATGAKNAALSAQLFIWNETCGRGVVFDSSTGFRLPDSSVLSPDASWVVRAAWDALTETQRRGYPPICPQVVFELVSASDEPYDTRRKIASYLTNGCALGILLDPYKRVVETYAQGEAVTIAHDPATLVIERRFFPGATADLNLDVAKIFGT
jgi:Uma2 family endonuclease